MQEKNNNSISVVVDRNLLYLLEVLLDLDYHNFDRDILRKINELKELVDSKLFGSIDLGNHNILDENIVINFKTD